MKKQNCTYLLLLSLLFSCSETTFKEKRKTLTSLPTISESLAKNLQDKCLESSFTAENCLYSPIGSKLIEQYKKDDDGFEALYSNMNVQMEHFSLKDTFATAATTGNTDNGKFKDSVATFEGSYDELNKAIRDYFQVEVDTVKAPGIYYYSYLLFSDAFPKECTEEDGLAFNGSGSYSYVSYYNSGKYYEDDDFAMVELSLSETKFRVLMKKGANTIARDTIFTQELKTGLIDVRIPKFEIRTDSTTVVSDGSAERQINNFKFDKTGVYGESFTYNSPTSPELTPTIDFTFTFDSTFTFASMLNDVPLFYGQIVELNQ